MYVIRRPLNVQRTPNSISKATNMGIKAHSPAEKEAHQLFDALYRPIKASANSINNRNILTIELTSS